MTDSKKKKIEVDASEIETETVTEIENETHEEKHNTPSIPDVARFKRPPAFERGNNFARGGKQNTNFQPAIRKAAQRGR